MVIVVKVILDATVALVDLTASLHRALIRGLGGPQIVTECLYIKVQPHCATAGTDAVQVYIWQRENTKEDNSRYAIVIAMLCVQNIIHY